MNLHIGYADRHRSDSGIMVTYRLDVIQHLRRSGVAVSFVTLVDDLPQLFLIAQEIDFRLYGS